MVFVDSGKIILNSSYREGMDRICLQCGLPYGEHTGDECPVIIAKKTMNENSKISINTLASIFFKGYSENSIKSMLLREQQREKFEEWIKTQITEWVTL